MIKTMQDLVSHVQLLKSKSTKKIVIEAVQNFIKSNPKIDSIAWSQDDDINCSVGELYLKTNREFLSLEAREIIVDYFDSIKVDDDPLLENSWEDDEYPALEGQRKISPDEKKILKDLKSLEKDMQKISPVMIACFGTQTRIVVKKNSCKEYTCFD